MIYQYPKEHRIECRHKTSNSELFHSCLRVECATSLSRRVFFFFLILETQQDSLVCDDRLNFFVDVLKKLGYLFKMDE